MVPTESIERNAKVLRLQQSDVKYRHDTWTVHAKPLIEEFLRNASKHMSETHHAFHPFISIDAPSSAEELIMLKLKPNLIGQKRGTDGGSELIYEEGCTLSFSKWHDGTVAIFLYPFTSKVHEMSQKEFVMAARLNPMEIRAGKLEKWFKNFLLIANASSLTSGMASRQRFLGLRLGWLRIKDVRNRERLADHFKRKTLSLSLGFLLSILTAFVSGWAVKTYLS